MMTIISKERRSEREGEGGGREGEGERDGEREEEISRCPADQQRDPIFSPATARPTAKKGDFKFQRLPRLTAMWFFEARGIYLLGWEWIYGVVEFDGPLRIMSSRTSAGSCFSSGVKTGSYTVY